MVHDIAPIIGACVGAFFIPVLFPKLHKVWQGVCVIALGFLIGWIFLDDLGIVVCIGTAVLGYIFAQIGLVL